MEDIILSLLIFLLWLHTSIGECKLHIGVSADSDILNVVTHIYMNHHSAIWAVDTLRVYPCRHKSHCGTGCCHGSSRNLEKDAMISRKIYKRSLRACLMWTVPLFALIMRQSIGQSKPKWFWNSFVGEGRDFSVYPGYCMRYWVVIRMVRVFRR